jgi:hypothetical protein
MRKISIAYPLALILLFCVALALRMLFASAYPTLLWSDEIFQTLEQAHRLVFGYGIVPWEFRAGARSWLLPGLLAGVMAATKNLAAGSTGYLTGVRLSLSLLSLSLPLSALVLARRRYGPWLALVAACFVGLWFELIYFAPKAFSEVVAAHLFVPALVLLDDRSRSRRAAISAGVLLGLAVAIRPHFGLAGSVVVFLSLRTNAAHARPLLLACAAPLLASGVLDAVTWGVPFQSIAQNLAANLAGPRAQRNGSAPWFAYLLVPLRVWGAWALLLAPLIALGSRGRRVLVLAALTVLATHMLVPHKEYRYVYLALALALMLAALGICELAQRLTRLRGAVAVMLLAIGLYASATLGLHYDYRAASLTGSSGEPPFMWTHFRGVLLAFEALSSDDSVCGVGLENRDWSRTGGYTYLHRHVPLFEIHDNDAYKHFVAGFNVFIADATSPPMIGRFARGSCWDNVCIYRRAGGCVVFAGYDINQRLIARGD